MIYRFANCELTPERHEFRRDGALQHLEPQVFQLLKLLVSRAGDTVTRDEIVEVVWGGRIVSEATIAARISATRSAVGDSGKAQVVIATVTRVGLKCVAKVETVPAPTQPPPPSQRAPLQMHMTPASDGSLIAWTATGDGPPLLRAGHWLTNLDRDRDSLIWGPWLDRLQAGRRLVRYDSRGTGLSDHDCGALSLDAYVDDMLAVADAAGLERFDIFAASQSFAVSCAFAVRYPDRVRRIVSYAGWALGGARRDATTGADMTQTLGQLLRLGWAQPDGGYMKSFVSLFMPGANAEQIEAFVALQMASTTPEQAVRIREVISEFDVTPLLSELRCPVLVVHTRGDNLHPFPLALHLMRHLPDARLLPLESNNHILMPDEPAFTALMDGVDAFLA